MLDRFLEFMVTKILSLPLEITENYNKAIRILGLLLMFPWLILIAIPWLICIIIGFFIIMLIEI